MILKVAQRLISLKPAMNAKESKCKPKWICSYEISGCPGRYRRAIQGAADPSILKVQTRLALLLTQLLSFLWMRVVSRPSERRRMHKVLQYSI